MFKLQKYTFFFNIYKFIIHNGPKKNKSCTT